MAAAQTPSYPSFHWEEIHLQDSITKVFSLFSLYVSVGEIGVLSGPYPSTHYDNIYARS